MLIQIFQTEKLKSFILRSVIDRFGLGSLFNGISTFVGYLMLKPSLYKNSSDAI